MRRRGWWWHDDELTKQHNVLWEQLVALGLSAGICNLLRGSFGSLDEIATASDDELLTIRNMGPLTLQRVRAVIPHQSNTNGAEYRHVVKLTVMLLRAEYDALVQAAADAGTTPYFLAHRIIRDELRDDGWIADATIDDVT